MLRKTQNSYVWLGILCFGLTSQAAAKEPASLPAPVSVAVYNDVGVPTDTLLQAEQVAIRVFREAKMNVEWVNCATGLSAAQNPVSCGQAIFPSYLQLRIAAHPRTLSESAFGVSYMSNEGVGCYSNVFYARVEELHRTFNHSEAMILGHVMAHEIGHLLLGVNSHAVTGIMSAHWYKGELASASRGALLFNGTESNIMRQRVSSTVLTANKDLVPIVPVSGAEGR